MKRLSTLILSLVMVLSLLPVSAFAENGPCQDNWDGYYLSFIRLSTIDEEGNIADEYDETKVAKIFKHNKANNDLLAGVSYDKLTNTLTLDNANYTNMVLQANMMGDDFKLTVSGVNSLAGIIISSGEYGGSLSIEGKGTLNVNKNQILDDAIVLNAEGVDAKLSFGKEVNVNIYARKDVAKVKKTPSTDAKDVFSFGNNTQAQIARENFSEDYVETADCCFYRESEYESSYRKVICKTDKNGIYLGGFYTYLDANEQEIGSGYEIEKYEYIEKYNVYVQDYSFGERGTLKLSEDEFEKSDYSFAKEQGETPEEIEYYKPEDIDSGEELDWHYSSNKVTSKEDPDGIYGYVEHTEKNEQTGEYEPNGIYGVRRFVYYKDSGKLIEDETFEYQTLTYEQLTANYTIVYAYEDVWVNWCGSTFEDEKYLFKDSQNKKYVVDDDVIYECDENEKIELFGKEYYLPVLAEGVTIDDINPCEANKTYDDYYTFTLQGSQFKYVGEKPEEIKSIDFVDIGTVWRTLEYNKPVPFTAEVNPDSDCVNQMDLVKESWRNTKDNTEYSSDDTVAKNLTYGTYEYTATLKAKDGYVFDPEFRFVYGGTEYAPQTFSFRLADGKKTLILSDFIQPITTSHTHKLVVKKKKSATYFANGYSGDKVCSICGKTTSKGHSTARLKLKTPGFSVTAGNKSFKVKYSKVKDATGFQVRYKCGGSWITKNFNTKKSVTKTINKLKKAKKYTVQIRAFVKSGKKTAYSDWTKTKKVTVK